MGSSGTTYYNSASEVEEELMGKGSIDLRTLSINEHSKADPMPIDYCRSLAKTAGQREIGIIIAKDCPYYELHEASRREMERRGTVKNDGQIHLRTPSLDLAFRGDYKYFRTIR